MGPRGKREDLKWEVLSEGKREEGAVGHFECHLGAVWGVIWEPFGRSFGGSFGASFGGHSPLPWEVPISQYLRSLGAPLPEPTLPYGMAQRAPNFGAPKEGP